MSMNYKKIIESRQIRLKLLEFLSFIPDETMIKFQYWLKTSNRLDLVHPKRFTEKIQYYKLRYKNPEMIRCVDKYDVREYVREKGYDDLLIHCYGVYEEFDEIEWEKLPMQFVLKDTLGGGGNSVIIVKNKENVDKYVIKKTVDSWIQMKAHTRSAGREWPYYNGKNHRIIVEEFIESEESTGGLVDYKFFCFNGKPSYLYVIADREIGKSAGLGIYNSEFERLSVQRKDEKPLLRQLEKPSNFELMKQIASKLAGVFPEVRVDLYNVNGKILFGEMTFFDGSGYMTFVPDAFDFELGKEFIIPIDAD